MYIFMYSHILLDSYNFVSIFSPNKCGVGLSFLCHCPNHNNLFFFLLPHTLALQSCKEKISTLCRVRDESEEESIMFIIPTAIMTYGLGSYLTSLLCITPHLPFNSPLYQSPSSLKICRNYRKKKIKDPYSPHYWQIVTHEKANTKIFAQKRAKKVNG